MYPLVAMVTTIPDTYQELPRARSQAWVRPTGLWIILIVFSFLSKALSLRLDTDMKIMDIIL